MDTNFFRKFTIYHFLLLWLVLNLLSAGFSELYSDEAYYWMYSRFLDWGYFDHPPMVAVMIKIGYALFHNELGVRLMAVILTTGTLFVIYQLLDYRRPILYALVVFSVFAINQFGFITLPDNFILFFSSLFFLIYKKYLAHDELKYALLLSLIIACMFYSKYHAVLVVGFTVLSNLRLLRRTSFWMMTAVSLLLFAPHIYWQISHHFPSVEYHLVDRASKGYQFRYTYEYILGQAVYYGPFVGFLLFYAAFRQPALNRFDKALKYNLFGTLIFFLLASYKDDVEVNWTITIFIPLIILAFQYSPAHPEFRQWIRYLAIPSILIISMVKIQVMTGFIKIPGDVTDQFRGHKDFAQRLSKLANGLPIVANKYQTASLLSFYGDELIGSLNVDSRKNQFQLWDIEEKYRNQKVVFLNDHLKGEVIDDYRHRPTRLTIIDSLPVFKDVIIDAESKQFKQKSDASIQLKFLLHSRSMLNNYRQIKQYPTHLVVEIVPAGKSDILVKSSPLLDIDKIGTEQPQVIEVETPADAGDYEIWVSLETTHFGNWYSKKYPLVIQN